MMFAQTRMMLGGSPGFSFRVTSQQRTNFRNRPRKAAIDSQRADGAILQTGPRAKCLRLSAEVMRGFVGRNGQACFERKRCELICDGLHFEITFRHFCLLKMIPFEIPPFFRDTPV